MEIHRDDEAISVVWLHCDRNLGGQDVLVRIADRLDWATYGVDAGG